MKTNQLTKLLLCLCITFSFSSFAQLNLPRGSQMSTISQQIGTTTAYIKYSRPSVNKREIWGKLVPYGMNNLGFGTAEESPWRAGANENTIIKFTTDVTINGKKLKAGKYGFHVIVNPNNAATLIFSKNYNSWGSYFYDSSEDALRVETTMKDHSFTEQLTYEFIDVTANSAVAALNWEKKQIPFKIEVDVTKNVLAMARKKMQGQDGFNRQTWEQAANYALRNGGDLNEALGWINNAIAGQFYSQQNFNNTNIKASILNKLGKKKEAIATLDSYVPQASILELHQYGRQLIGFDKKDKALEIFKLNAKKNKGKWPVNYGLGRGYSAKGEYKKAIKYLKKALINAPNKGSKDRVQANINKLEKGQDIN